MTCMSPHIPTQSPVSHTHTPPHTLSHSESHAILPPNVKHKHTIHQFKCLRGAGGHREPERRDMPPLVRNLCGRRRLHDVLQHLGCKVHFIADGQLIAYAQLLERNSVTGR